MERWRGNGRREIWQSIQKFEGKVHKLEEVNEFRSMEEKDLKKEVMHKQN